MQKKCTGYTNTCANWKCTQKTKQAYRIVYVSNIVNEYIKFVPFVTNELWKAFVQTKG